MVNSNFLINSTWQILPVKWPLLCKPISNKHPASALAGCLFVCLQWSKLIFPTRSTDCSSSSSSLIKSNLYQTHFFGREKTDFAGLLFHIVGRVICEDELLMINGWYSIALVLNVCFSIVDWACIFICIGIGICILLWQIVSWRAETIPKKVKISRLINGVKKSEMNLFWCISITSNVKTCKKFDERA